MKCGPCVMLLLAPLALLGCGSPEPADNKTVPGEVIAKQLDDAAEQSRPGAKEVLKEAADEAAQHDRLAPAGEPGSFAQEAMEDAGEEPEPRN